MPLHTTSSNRITSSTGLPASVKPLRVSENLTDVQNGFGTPLEDTFETRANPRQLLEASSPKLQSKPTNPTALLAIIAPLLMGSMALAVGFYGLMKGHKAEINALEQKALNQSEKAAQALEVVVNKITTLETAQADAKIKIQTLASTVEHQTAALADLQALQTAQTETINQLETKIEIENKATQATVQVMLDGARLDQENQVSLAIEQQLTAREQAKAQEKRRVRTTFGVDDEPLTLDDLASYEWLEPSVWAETSVPPVKRPPPAPPTSINPSEAVQNANLN